MAYLIGEVTKELLETVHEFCEKEVRDLCRECDRSGEVPLGLFRQAMELQFHMLDIPECYGGLGLDKISAGALLEEMAKADAGFAVTFAASSLGLKPILFAGSEELKKEACALLEQGGLGAFCLTEPEAGSDAGAIKTRAEKRDGAYLLNGRKCFITNGSIASFYSVAALTENGEGKKEISMFFVRADAEGVKAGGHEDKMGIRTSDTCDVIFENVLVPERNRIGMEGQGFETAMKALDEARAFMGCVAVGIAQRALEEAVAYTDIRKQFGKPLNRNQGMQFKLAGMAMQTEAGRQMTAYALTRMEQGISFKKEAAMAKCCASDAAVKVTQEAVQCFGGYGYSREYPVEKLLRDAKIFQIFEGTNEILKTIIAREIQTF